MDSLIESIVNCLRTRNWFAAIFLCLGIPDMCASLESSNRKTNEAKYKKWFVKYMLPKYSRQIGCPINMLDDIDDKEVRSMLIKKSWLEFSAEDCYALRCSVYHQATSSISHQNARKILDNFIFRIPNDNSLIHMNLLGEADGYVQLQLQVDIFCNDFIDAYHIWLRNQNKGVQKLASENTFKLVE